MKKIALPTRNGNIDDHFGHCAFYTIITVNDNNEVAKTEIMKDAAVSRTLHTSFRKTA